MKLPAQHDCWVWDLPDTDESSNVSLDAQFEMNDTSSISGASSTDDSDNHVAEEVSILAVNDHRSLIERMIASPLQNYQEFLQSFMFLLSEDIVRHTASGSSFRQVSHVSGQSTDFMSTLEAGIAETVLGEPVLENPATEEEDQLEELVLSSVPCCDLPQSRPKIRLQVDNFIVDEDVLTDSTGLNTTLGFDLPMYCVDSASFHQQGNRGVDENLLHDTFVNCHSVNQDEGPEMVAPNVDSSLPHIQVEPFVLDADFDYDSVRLTPKYSLEELNSILQRAASASKDHLEFVTEPASYDSIEPSEIFHPKSYDENELSN